MSGPEFFFRTISEQGYFFRRPFGPDIFFITESFKAFATTSCLIVVFATTICLIQTFKTNSGFCHKFKLNLGFRNHCTLQAEQTDSFIVN